MGSLPMKVFIAGVLSLGTLGCATYQSNVGAARIALETGNLESALTDLKKFADTENGDQLVYLLDYATALQIAGRYKESNTYFLKADQLAESLDYHSISRVTGSLLLNEEVKQYKGDTFEKIFINAELALNFLELDQRDDALVEARRINEKFQKLRQEDKKSFEMNPFAKYLSALIWEADKKYDDASIAYNEAYKISPIIDGIEADLIRSAKLAQRPDEYKKWKAKFPAVKEEPWWYNKKQAEIIVIHQQGWGPRKDFNPGDTTWPILRRVSSRTNSSEAMVGGEKVKSRIVYDVADAAIESLNDDRGALLARRVGAYVAKDVVAERIRKDNELLGVLAWFAMHASERADLRQWSTLPRSIQVIRIPVKEGSNDIVVQGLDVMGAPTADRLERKNLHLRAGEKKFLVWRTF